MKNEWLENEIKILKKEQKYQKKRGDELMPYLMSLVIILLISTSSMYAHSSLSQKHEYAGFFPSTWTCPNKSCRYENYDGINHCAICGSRRR